MMEKQKTYIAIDLKSFYASVECKERNRNPLTTNLVVADKSRTEKTICLAVSPSLKSYGIPGAALIYKGMKKHYGVKAAICVAIVAVILSAICIFMLTQTPMPL